ncbi:MAG: malT [Firmicutes bacterium]|nr:malT [Bacillota bacterium]
MTIYNKNKFIIPKTKLKVIDRKNIFGLLDKSQNTKLSIIWAQAGSGKTAAVVSWLGSRNLENNTVWISLDERDDTPEVFSRCLAEAIEKVLGEDVMPLAEQTMDSILNRISALDRSLIFVFDDFHHIKNDEILKGIKYFIDGIGGNIHIIITSRSKLNLNLARLRLNGEVTEIDRKDLNFTYEEAAEFVAENAEVEIPEKTVKQLWERTEGWVAGIQMALLTMRDRKNVGEFEEKFSGCSSFIQDYFSEEIFNNQEEVIKDFLLKTSILEELSPELCNAVTGRNDSQQLLEQIYDTNMFIDKLDYDGRIFRYRRLFREFLMCKAKGMNVEAFYETSSRAAKWYEENGLLNSAINQYMEVGNFEPVVDLVESECIRMILCGEQHEVMRWLENIPQDIIFKNPRFCIARMFIYISDDISYAKYREFAERALEDYGDEEYRKECRGIMWIVKGDRHLVKSDYHRSLDCYTEAFKSLESSALYSIALSLKLGVACFYMKDLDGEKEAFDRAMLLSQAYQDDVLYLVVSRTVVFTKLLRRQLVECENICNVCINSKMSDSLKKSTLMSIFYIILALVHLDRNDISRAEEFVHKGIEPMERDAKPLQHYYTMYTALYVYAGVLLEKGDKAGLEKVCDRIEDLSKAHGDERLPDIYYLNKVESYFDVFKMERFLEAGKTSLVEKYISKMDFKNPEEVVMFCQTLVDKGKSDDALMLLNKVLTTERDDGNRYVSLKAVILRAEIFSQEDQYENATRDFKEALTLGYGSGFVRIFSFKNVKTSKMLIKTIRGMKFNKDYYKMGEYLNRIAGLYSTDEGAEIISRREKEVLRLIENGAKNSEIAKELFITESTAKSHILNIYSKLGVHNRVQAVAKAKEMGII